MIIQKTRVTGQNDQPICLDDLMVGPNSSDCLQTLKAQKKAKFQQVKLLTDQVEELIRKINHRQGQNEEVARCVTALSK